MTATEHVTQLGQALWDQKWWIVSALTIYGIIRLLKAFPKVAEKIPPNARPLVALGLGLLSAGLNDIVMGTPWQTALINGVVTAALTVFGHEVIIERLRNGRELFEPKEPPSGDDDGTGTTGDSPEASTDGPKVPGFKRARTLILALGGYALILVAGLGVPHLVAGCASKRQAVSTVDVLTTQTPILCAALVPLYPDAALIEACEITEKVAPVVRDLFWEIIRSRRKEASKVGAPAVVPPPPVVRPWRPE